MTSLPFGGRWPRRPGSQWATLWALSAASFMGNLDSRAIVPLLPSVAEDLGVGVAAAGLVVTAYMVPYGAFLREIWALSYPVIGLILAVFGAATLLASRLLPLVPRRLAEPRRLLVGGLISAIGYLALAGLGPWQPAPLAMGLLGLGFITAHSVLQARSTEIAPRARGTSVAVFACALFVGGAVGTAAIGPAIELWGYRPLFAMLGVGMACFALAGSAALARAPQPAPAPRGEDPAPA